MDIRNNIMDFNDKIGIYAYSSSGDIIDNNIQGDMIDSKGVKLDDCDELLPTTVEDNNIINCKVGVDADPTNVIINANLIQDCTIGIRVLDSFALITNNIITGGTYGIYSYNSDPIIAQNTISNNVYGIYLEQSSPVIEDNLFIDNFYAIFVAEDSNPVINNNTYVNNTYDLYLAVWPMDIDPDTLNLKSQGKWITCYLEPSDEMYLSTLDISTIRISEIGGLPVMILAENHPTAIGDEDGDGTLDLMIKFDRSEVEDVVWPGDIEITVIGELSDGTPFAGYCTIRVIEPGK
jgi:parallel beta-helix repeat protein